MEPRERRRPSLLVALFVAVTWAATSFAVAGILSVVLDRDPVEVPAPVYAGPAAVALAGVVVWLAVGFTARARTPWVGSLAAVAVVYLSFTGLALLTSFALFAEQVISPFVLAAALLAGIAVAVTHHLGRPPFGGPPNAGLSATRSRS